jgi:hypothetical protein
MYNDDGEQGYLTPGVFELLGFLAHMPALDGTATPLLGRELGPIQSIEPTSTTLSPRGQNAAERTASPPTPYEAWDE